MAIKVVRFLNIFAAALLAGTSFGIWLGFNPMSYSPSTYLEQQNHLVRSLNTFMIILVFGTTILTITSAYLQRTNKITSITLFVAAAFFISCIVITRLGNIPIQNVMLNWNANSLPENWNLLRDQWWTFHIMRTITELIALSLIVWTNVRS